jgi:hypothetical protein
MPAGVMTTPLEVELDPPTFMLPPHPDHTRMASERTKPPVNFEIEDFDVPVISDPLSWKIRVLKSLGGRVAAARRKFSLSGG